MLFRSVLLRTEQGFAAAILPKNEEHNALIFVPEKNDRPIELTGQILSNLYTGVAYSLTEPVKLSDTGSPAHEGRYGHWFFGPLYASKHIYIQVALAALLTNIFALATSGFSMIVYDRVMPNGAMETLVALLVGVFIIFEIGRAHV